MVHKGTVAIETERLTLRPFAEDDASAMFRNLYSDAEAMRFLPWDAHVDTAESEELISGYVSAYAAFDFYAWAIIPKDFGEPIGYIDTSAEERINAVKVDYGIGKHWWRKGYMSEAIAAVIRFFFEEIGINRVYATHDPRNPNSCKVMQKCGMLYEGTLRQARRRKGEYSDRAMYAILAEDYFGAAK